MTNPTYCVTLKNGVDIFVRAGGPEQAFFKAAKKTGVDVSTDKKIDEYHSQISYIILHAG